MSQCTTANAISCHSQCHQLGHLKLAFLFCMSNLSTLCPCHVRPLDWWYDQQISQISLRMLFLMMVQVQWNKQNQSPHCRMILLFQLWVLGYIPVCLYIPDPSKPCSTSQLFQPHLLVQLLLGLRHIRPTCTSEQAVVFSDRRDSTSGFPKPFRRSWSCFKNQTLNIYNVSLVVYVCLTGRIVWMKWLYTKHSQFWMNECHHGLNLIWFTMTKLQINKSRSTQSQHWVVYGMLVTCHVIWWNHFPLRLRTPIPGAQAPPSPRPMYCGAALQRNRLTCLHCAKQRNSHTNVGFKRSFCLQNIYPHLNKK